MRTTKNGVIEDSRLSTIGVAARGRVCGMVCGLSGASRSARVCGVCRNAHGSGEVAVWEASSVGEVALPRKGCPHGGLHRSCLPRLSTVEKFSFVSPDRTYNLTRRATFGRA